jgi:spiro-SPASM protein
MKLAAVIYAGSLSTYALKAIGSGPSAYDRCLGFVQGLPGLERAVVAQGRLELPDGGFPKIRKESWTIDLLLEEIGRIGEGMDAVLLAWADEPFLDRRLAATMLEDFRRYRAEYGFADGYPIGLSAEILAPRAVPALRRLASELPGDVGRDALFTVVQKDINAFDIETDISPLDLRDLRLTLACGSKRDFLLVERLAAAGVSDAGSALKVIPENLGLLRTLPAFIQVQIASGCPQACALCAYPLFGGDILSLRRDMSRERFASLMDQVVELCDDAVIDISLWGEPSMHEDIGGIIDEVAARPSLSLIVETSGLGWDRALVEGLAARDSGRIDWVISLDASSPELYAELRGPGFAEATAFAEALLGLFPRRAHVQLVRAKENEAELEAFWRGWKKKTDKVIVQKYSRFAGLLPERKVSDLSPLVRRPCWHLKRDLSILVDGSMPLCRDFSHGDILLGNAFEERRGNPAGIAAAWSAAEVYHAAHIEACAKGTSSLFPAPCEACDEFYTYNA